MVYLALVAVIMLVGRMSMFSCSFSNSYKLSSNELEGEGREPVQWNEREGSGPGEIGGEERARRETQSKDRSGAEA